MSRRLSSLQRAASHMRRAIAWLIDAGSTDIDELELGQLQRDQGHLAERAKALLAEWRADDAEADR